MATPSTIHDPDNLYDKRRTPSPSSPDMAPSRLNPAPSPTDTFAATNQSPAALGGLQSAIFDPGNADRAFRGGLLANGIDANNPNGAAGPLMRRSAALQRLFPILAAMNPSMGNANSPQDSQAFYSGLPGNLESILHNNNPQTLLSYLFSDNGGLGTPQGNLRNELKQNPQELANTLSAILGLNSSPYASSSLSQYLDNLVANTNANAGLLNKHGGDLLGAVNEALQGVKTYQ